MLKSELVQTDKHSIKIWLRRKNLRFLRRTNHNTNSLAKIAELNFGGEIFFESLIEITEKTQIETFSF